MSMDDWQDAPPAHGSYWLDRDGMLCQVLHVSFDREEIELLYLDDGEEYLEWIHLFGNLYDPVDEEDVPLHLLGVVP